MSEDCDIISISPENRETPLRDAQSWVTPNRYFFVRSHFDAPEIDHDDWKLSITGCVHRPLELRWDQINSLPQRSVFATLECAGNGRSFLQPKVAGVQWRAGAVGHAEWSGVPLNHVLEEVGLKTDAIEVLFVGADSGIEGDHAVPHSFARSLPIEKTLHPDTLLATRMNGEPLDRSHGFPVRLLVPGWYGVASVKWLQSIEAVSQPFDGYYQTKKYTIQRLTGRGTQTEVVGAMPVKSEIIRPTPDAVLGVGTNRIFGTAWAGEDAVDHVEVSVNGGDTWTSAELIGPRAPYSWTLWEYLWENARPAEHCLIARAISSSGLVQPARHDPRNGGYLINFSRPISVTVDGSRQSADVLGGNESIHQTMSDIAQSLASEPLDVEMAFDDGGGI